MDNKQDFSGKRILFFSPLFFGYEDKIVQKLQNMGAVVDFYNERSIRNSLARALLKVIPCIFNNKTEKYYSNIISENKNNKYDYVFVIKGDMITNKSLTNLRATFTESKFILYLWDSIENIIGIEDKFKYFDAVFSFDKKDVKNNVLLKFRPLFYCDEYAKDRKGVTNFKYDVFFCGTIHSDRYKILSEIKKECFHLDIKFYGYFYLQSKFIYYYYWLFKSEFRFTRSKDFKYIPLSSNDLSDIVDCSRCVVDIPSPAQNGLTMRTIEMLGMKKKIITTNYDIINYDFYNENNICVINKKNPNISKDFIDGEYNDVDSKIYEKYSLEYWLLEILC